MDIAGEAGYKQSLLLYRIAGHGLASSQSITLTHETTQRLSIVQFEARAPRIFIQDHEHHRSNRILRYILRVNSLLLTIEYVYYLQPSALGFVDFVHLRAHQALQPSRRESTDISFPPSINVLASSHT